jgi:hypothetical protein
LLSEPRPPTIHHRTGFAATVYTGRRQAPRCRALDDRTAMNMRTYALFAILCLFWGIPYFFIKLALVDVSPVFIA